MEDFQRALVNHVHTNAAIYRRNLRQRLPQQLRDGLIDHIEWGLLDHLVRHPHIAPLHAASGDAASTADARYQEAALYAAIAASGTVAALETWLRGPDPLDQEWAVRAIMRGIAEWWSTD